jgi:hypothetical protein
MQYEACKKKDSTGTTVQGESFFVAQQSSAPSSIAFPRITKYICSLRSKSTKCSRARLAGSAPMESPHIAAASKRKIKAPEGLIFLTLRPGWALASLQQTKLLSFH